MSTKVERRYARGHQRDKSGWKIFLKPGWILLVLTIIAFSYFAFSFLAPWQLGKDDDIVQRNEQIEASFESDPVPYQEVLGTGGTITEEQEWARVTMTGNYLPDRETLLRLRPVENTPVYQALTPFATNSGDVVLVNRGYVHKPGNAMPEIERAPSNEVTITGHVRLNEPEPENAPMTDQGRLQVYGINTGQIGEAVNQNLGESYLQLSEGSAGELTAMPIPQLDRGSHLSYGWQWIAFGVMAPVGLAYFVWAELRERRRVRAEEAAVSADEGDSDSSPFAPDSASAAEEDRNSPDFDSAAGTTDRTTRDDESGTVKTATHSRDVRARYGGQHTDFWSRQARRSRERF